MPVLGRDGVPVDPVGARGQLARRGEDEPLAVLRGQDGRDRRAAARPAARRAREPPVERLGEHEHHARGRALQPLPGRGLGPDVGGVPVGGRRPRERGEQGGWEREQAHPAESMPGSGRDLEAPHELVELLGGAGELGRGGGDLLRGGARALGALADDRDVAVVSAWISEIWTRISAAALGALGELAHSWRTGPARPATSRCGESARRRR